ncbi:MAG: amino acid permease [Deltaproteobacteria bacterium]|nr:amino acid permease [Deltaproteobacteria bacterium]
MENVKNVKVDSVDDGSAQARFGLFGGVFTPCVLTILGVIMFMRAGFVVGHSGIWLGLLILGFSKMITSLTALSISAISTNIKMKGGGVYYMISRVLGPDFGGSIGITLYLAQAVGVAFYVIGFSEALFSVAIPLLGDAKLGGLTAADMETHFHITQVISSLIVGVLFMLTSKGADLAIKTQYFVLAILLLSIASFIVGGFIHFDGATYKASMKPQFTSQIGFWAAFAIFFPATTGITAGANMSGDLKDPAKSIPWGTIWAIIFTGAIYGLQMFLVAGSASRADLIADSFGSLQKMSLFGPLVVLGVFAATLSSALGSFLGAPRILQAMGQDRLMKPMIFFAKGEGVTNEPKRATVLTFIIAVAIIWAGDLNAVAEVISMFFLIAYGMINLSAFVESKSGNPSFRPTFKYFHWVTALVGALGCGIAMMKINDSYALIALGVTGLIYFYLKKRDIKTTYGDAKRGYIFQRTKDNLLALEGLTGHAKNWRPIMVTLSDDPQKEHSLIRTAGWLESGRGLMSVATMIASPEDDIIKKIRTKKYTEEEIKRIMESEGVIGFSNCVVSDNYYTALLDFIQSYSIGALKPNTVLLEMPDLKIPESLEHFYKKVELISSFQHNITVYKSGSLAPDKKKRVIDLWWRGEQNGSLMAVFAYLMTLHSTWSGATLRLMRIVLNDAEKEIAQKHMEDLKNNIRIPAEIKIINSNEPPLEVINRESGNSDFVFLGMNAQDAESARKSLDIFGGLESLPTVLLVWSNGEADIFA